MRSKMGVSRGEVGVGWLVARFGVGVMWVIYNAKTSM